MKIKSPNANLYGQILNKYMFSCLVYKKWVRSKIEGQKFSRDGAYGIVGIIFSELIKYVMEGNDVVISGLGTFSRKTFKERVIGNLRVGNSVCSKTIPEHYKVQFVIDPKLQNLYFKHLVWDKCDFDFDKKKV